MGTILLATLITGLRIHDCDCPYTHAATAQPIGSIAGLQVGNSVTRGQRAPYNSFASGKRFRSRHRCTSLRANGGAGNILRVSISTLPGQSRVLTWQSTMSVEPMPMMSQAPGKRPP